MAEAATTARDETDALARLRWPVTVVAVAVGVTAHTMHGGSPIAESAHAWSVLSSAAAVGLFLRMLPVRRGHLLALVGLAAVALALGAWVGIAHLDLDTLLPALGLVLVAVVATVARSGPATPVRPSGVVAAGTVAVVVAAVWWSVVATGGGMSAPVPAEWFVLGLGGAALTAAPRRALFLVTVVAVLVDPVDTLLAPIFGAWDEFGGQLGAWAVPAVLVALLLVLDGQRRQRDAGAVVPWWTQWRKSGSSPASASQRRS